METLAFLHLAIAYEDPNPSPNLRFKDTDLRAASSVAMGFIASGIVASTLTYADAARATLYYGSRGSDVAKLQEALGNIAADGVFGSETLARLKSYQAKKGLMVDGIAGAETLSSLGWSSSSKNSKGQDVRIGKGWGEPEQYGKLQLMNDTPYMAIVLLYEPGNEQPSRYAYIPPCYQRTLLDTYSSSWKISFNQSRKFSVAEKSDRKNDVFEVKLSKLSQEDTQLCEYDDSIALKTKPVRRNPSDFSDRVFAVPKKQIMSIARPEIRQGIGDARKIENKIDTRPYTEAEFMREQENLSSRGGEVHDTIDRTLAALLRKDGVNQYSAELRFVATALRLKHFADELKLDNPDDPTYGIRTILKNWIEEENCREILLPVLNVNLSDTEIEQIKYLFDKAEQINDMVPSNLSKQKPNDSLPIDVPGEGQADVPGEGQDPMSQNCALAQSQHPIFVNSSSQSQRISKKCI